MKLERLTDSPMLVLAMPGSGVRSILKDAETFHLDGIGYRTGDMGYFSGHWYISIRVLKWLVFKDLRRGSARVFYGWGENWKDIARLVAGDVGTWKAVVVYAPAPNQVRHIIEEYRQTEEYQTVERKIFESEGTVERPVDWYVDTYSEWAQRASTYVMARGGTVLSETYPLTNHRGDKP
jgi:hypothetical protein